MDRKWLDTITVITSIVLLPIVVTSAYANLSGAIPFEAYATMWREPIALLLGFWLRGVDK